LIIAVGTLVLEAVYTPVGTAAAATMGFAVFSLYNVAIGLSARSEFGTVFDRDTLSDRRQLMLYGISLGMAFLATELGFLQRLLGTTSLRAQEWLICLGFAVVLILVDEVIKFFLRRRRSQPAVESAAVAQVKPVGA
jgi:Ca2+-transporting ATPase